MLTSTPRGAGLPLPILRANVTPLRAPHPSLEPDAVVRRLTPHLSAARRRRIEKVLARRLASVTVVIERPYDPHNAAAVLRTVEAAGLTHVHIVEGEGGFSFSRKVTISAHKWLDIYVHRDTASCVRMLRDAGFERWAALPPDIKADKAHGVLLQPGVSLKLPRPVALFFGNEHAGLTQEAIDGCDVRFSLAMQGFTESYNLSVSAALALQLVCAQRRAQIGCVGDLPPGAITRLRAAYYARSTRHAVEVLMAGLR